jgi:hypothetical protein
VRFDGGVRQKRLRYADGKWYPFDAKGNELAKAMFEKAKKKDNIKVTVEGMEHDGKIFVAAARALSEMSPALNDRMASLFPDLNAIREVSRRVAITVGVDVARQCESNSRFCLNKTGDNKFVAERV